LTKDVHTDHQSTAEQTLERIERMLNTVVVGLEILTGICAGLEDDEAGANGDAEVEGVMEEVEEDEDEEMDEDGEEMDDEDLINEALDHADMTQGDLEAPTINTAVTLQNLLSLRLPTRLATLGRLTPLSFPPAGTQPSPHPPTTSVLSSLHLRAYEALNNLLLTIVASVSGSEEDLSRLSEMLPVQDLWKSLLGVVQIIASEPEVLKEKGQEMRVEVLEMASGCLWGAVRLGSGCLVSSFPHS
jgi:hypothetical protein